MSEEESRHIPTIPEEIQLLINCAKAADIYRNDDGRPFAAFSRDIFDRECHPLRSSQFHAWLDQTFYEGYDRFPRAAAFRRALDLLDQRAARHPQRPPEAALRVAQGLSEFHYEDEDRCAPIRRFAFALDLGDLQQHRVAEVTSRRWAITYNGNFNFLRPPGAYSLPNPETGAGPDHLHYLRRLLRFSPADWCRILAWLLAALRPQGPYPILVLQGPPGSGKSFAARLLRALIDPVAVPLIPLPNTAAGLVHQARRHWILAFDHVSRRPSQALAEALCRLASGTAFSAGDLKTHDHLCRLTRPLLLTVPAGAFRLPPDLQDRTLTVTLPALTPQTRRPESDLLDTFHSGYPKFLGALLDSLACALAHTSEIHLAAYPRLADAAVWAIAAACPQSGVTREEMSQALLAPSTFQVPKDPLPNQIEALMSTRAEWKGTATQLAEDLNTDAAPNQLTRRLKEFIPFLASRSITIDFARTGPSRGIIIKTDRHIVTPPGQDPPPTQATPSPAATSPAPPETSPAVETNRHIVTESSQSPQSPQSSQSPQSPQSSQSSQSSQSPQSSQSSSSPQSSQSSSSSSSSQSSQSPQSSSAPP
jgi:hypothetical protein